MLVVGACGGTDDAADPPAPTSIAPASTATTTTTTTPSVVSRRPFTTGHSERTYQRTAADGSTRDLLTEVWLPVGNRPFPLVAFAHGMSGHPRKFHELFEAWAAAGYAVVAPRFPLSAADAGGSLADSVADAPQQALDLEFVTARVLAGSADPADPLHGHIDPDALAVAGLSLGGGTALLASYSGCCPGLTPSVVLAFSPVPFATDQAPDAAPLFLMHGQKDTTLPYSGSRDYFDTAKNRRWLVTMPDAGHAAPYEDDPSAQDDLVQTVSIDVLDQFLLGDDDGVSRAESAVAASGLATIESAG